jgi:dCMP deaminase
MSIAKEISTWSKDPSTQVGAVIVDNNNRIISVGFNGFPKGIKDDDRLNNREDKYKRIVHAEVNAILFANTTINSCRIYTYPFMPCSSCAAMLIQSGIKMVLSNKSTNSRWENDFEISRALFKEAGVFLLEM